MRIAAAFRHAISGIIYCVCRERNMKVHLTAALVILGLAWYHKLSGIELGILVITIAGVITAEIFNTALETIVDKVSPDFHPLAKAAKDAAAGAVLIQAVAAVIIGYVLFGNKVL
ncbi:MAG: diacylglycerol kinase [Firmicutes bacterium]|nr:diacylglycerol kinase [Bacillota bacterium]